MDDVARARLLLELLGDRPITAMTLSFPGVSKRLAFEGEKDGSKVDPEISNKRVARKFWDSERNRLKVVLQKLAPGGTFVTAHRIQDMGKDTPAFGFDQMQRMLGDGFTPTKFAMSEQLFEPPVGGLSWFIPDGKNALPKARVAIGAFVKNP